MRYTTPIRRGSVYAQIILPLNQNIIQMTLSSRVLDYKTDISDTQLTAYAHLALSGTSRRSKSDIESYLKRNGIVLFVTTESGTVHYQMTVSKESFPKALSLLQELLFQFKCLRHEFLATKKLMQEEIREAKDNARLCAEIQFLNVLFPRNSIQYRETLRVQMKNTNEIHSRDVVHTHKNVMRGEWYLSLVGSQHDAKKLHSIISKLSKNSNLTARNLERYSARQSQSVYTTVKGKTNIELRIGNILPVSIQDDNYVPFVCGLNILGKVGGFSGRLMSTVREKEGLTYGIYATTAHFDSQNSGYWFIYTFFTAKDLQQGLVAIMRELKRLILKGVTDTEVKIFKEILSNQFLINHESNARRLTIYHSAILRGQTEDDLLAHIKSINSMTKEKINCALRKCIDHRKLVISGAGPITKEGTGLATR